MSKLYAQHNPMATGMDIAYGGGGGGKPSRRQTLGPGGGSDPGNSLSNRVDEGGLRYMTDEDRGNLHRNTAATVGGGIVGGAGRKLVTSGVALTVSAVNNNTD